MALLILSLIALVIYLGWLKKKPAQQGGPQQQAQSVVPSTPAATQSAAPSLREAGAVPVVCGCCHNQVSGYGSVGGYCDHCKEWVFDRAAYQSSRQQYGAACETLFVLMGYESVHVHVTNVADDYGRLFVSPGQLLFRSYTQEHPPVTIPFSAVSILKFTADHKLMLGFDGKGYTFDLMSKSYDGAEGLEFQRIHALCEEYKGQYGVQNN